MGRGKKSEKLREWDEVKEKRGAREKKEEDEELVKRKKRKEGEKKGRWRAKWDGGMGDEKAKQMKRVWKRERVREGTCVRERVIVRCESGKSDVAVFGRG